MCSLTRLGVLILYNQSLASALPGVPTAVYAAAGAVTVRTGKVGDPVFDAGAVGPVTVVGVWAPADRTGSSGAETPDGSGVGAPVATAAGDAVVAPGFAAADALSNEQTTPSERPTECCTMAAAGEAVVALGFQAAAADAVVAPGFAAAAAADAVVAPGFAVAAAADAVVAPGFAVAAAADAVVSPDFAAAAAADAVVSPDFAAAATSGTAAAAYPMVVLAHEPEYSLPPIDLGMTLAFLETFACCQLVSN
ncbi:hypothetical protein CAPTEDRAFT_200691 [Capitella teleta]|uniref:Uncharacterized protein n=1 Tax=Capitella teleta TaxID=283909 RepID=R7TPX2_CAPTE|nr:hypothetical protein CAPTEDRAFT_200691 [Capitella teleta]|eukprot:ELT95617.1 hypothetical protein CAPTEDRAFT_200691 [Capitella teleta]